MYIWNMVPRLLLFMLFIIFVLWMNDLVLALIHGRFLLVIFFLGCNKEASHKIRFPPWLIYLFIFPAIFFKIWIYGKICKSTRQNCTWVAVHHFSCRLKLWLNQSIPEDDSVHDGASLGERWQPEQSSRAHTRRHNGLRVGFMRLASGGTWRRVWRRKLLIFGYLVPVSSLHLPVKFRGDPSFVWRLAAVLVLGINRGHVRILRF